MHFRAFSYSKDYNNIDDLACFFASKGTPTSKEASSSEQKTETIIVENDEDGENEEKEIDVEGQEKKKKSKRGGDQCLRSGSGAKRDRASLKDRSDSSGPSVD